MKITKIYWDVDECNGVILPNEVEVPKEIAENPELQDRDALEEYLADWLKEKYGMTHIGYRLEGYGEEHPDKHPLTIRAYATIVLKDPLPEHGYVYTDESFTVSVNGKEYQMDFDTFEAGVDRKDRRKIEITWKNPDQDSFPEVFDALTYGAVMNGDIKLVGGLDNSIQAYWDITDCINDTADDDSFIDIDYIEDMQLVSPYDEFEPVVIHSGKGGDEA